MDLYGVLHLEPNAPMEDVRKSFQRLARELHPDKNGNSRESGRFGVCRLLRTVHVIEDENGAQWRDSRSCSRPSKCCETPRSARRTTARRVRTL
jgi:hypothetical protein